MIVGRGYRFSVSKLGGSQQAGVSTRDSADCPAMFVAVEAQVDEPAQVDRGDPHCELCPVLVDASIPHSAMPVGDDPRYAPFDHGPVLPVVGHERLVVPCSSGGNKLIVVVRYFEGAPAW
jgi:hypothetical protein